MSKLSATQERALAKFELNMPYSAYDIKESLATLDALVRKGYLREVTRGAGSMFSPQTHRMFRKVKS